VKIEHHSDSISFALHPVEAVWLLNSFQELQKAYETPLESLSEKEKAYWKGTLTDPEHPQIPLKNESESLEWERLEWKDLRHMKMVEWLKQFEDFNPQNEFVFTLLKEDTDLLLQITNDRRLLLAALHDVKEEDMHHDLDKLQENPKATALIEIDFLAFVQGVLLQALSEDSAD
jgi:hypothetical protein